MLARLDPYPDDVEPHSISRTPALAKALFLDLARYAWNALALLAALVVASACASSPSAGPAFAPSPEPSPGHARLYVFRIDPQSSLSTVELAIDGQQRNHLRDGEYATFELAAGTHKVDLRQRGLAFVSWGWNGERVRMREGETVYLEVSVRMSAQPLPPGTGRELEIPGRDSGAASENVFLQHRGKTEALDRLAGTTLRVE